MFSFALIPYELCCDIPGQYFCEMLDCHVCNVSLVCVMYECTVFMLYKILLVNLFCFIGSI